MSGHGLAGQEVQAGGLQQRAELCHGCLREEQVGRSGYVAILYLLLCTFLLKEYYL